MTEGPPAEGSASAALAALRSEIDALDRALVALLGRRREVVRRMRALKASHDLPRVDTSRERAMREALLEEGRAHGVPGALVQSVLAAVLEDSRALVSSDAPEAGPEPTEPAAPASGSVADE